MIERKYFRIIEEELKTKQITALVGLRQVGKSTILRYAFEKVKEKAIFLSFDNIEVLNYFENDIEFFIENYVKDYTYIFIDEIQYSKISGKQLKYIYDFQKDKKILISGSSLSEMAIHSLSYLVGRVNIIQVFPLDFREFLMYKEPEKAGILDKMRTFSQLRLIKAEFEEFLQYGAYPEVVLQDTDEKKRTVLRNIVNTYLLKEIREILRYENVVEFERILRRLSLSDGGIANKSNLSAELDINRMAFSKILDVLYKSAVIYTLQPFLKNKIKEIIKSPKIYLSDLGFKNNLVRNFNKLELRQDKGQIFESFILLSILNFGLEPKFWNYKNEFEVDFILEGNGRIFGIEVKSSLKDDSLSSSAKKFIFDYRPQEFIVFNEKVDSEKKVGETRIIFTSHLNIFSILEKIRREI